MTKRVLPIPKIKQLKNHCWPACFSMVAAYYGVNLSQEEIAEYFDEEDEVEFGGVGELEALRCAINFGFRSYARKNIGFKGIQNYINRGLPLIASVNTGPQEDQHVVVVRGYELNPSLVWINDPERVSLDRMLYENFALRWRCRPNGYDFIKYSQIIRK